MWYSAGTVTVTNGQKLVTGAGTDFVANVLAGQGFVGPDNRTYEIEQVVSATQLMLRTVFYGGSGAGQIYSIIPTQSLMKDLADSASQLISSFAGVRDGIGAGLMGDGTAAAPGLRFATDQDTGIRRYDNNAISLVTSGADRLIANNAGIGIGSVNDGKSALLVQGTDQSTAALTDGGAHGASLFLRAVGSGVGSGGAVLFGTTFGNVTPFAAVKAFVRQGDNNTAGDLIFALRAVTTDGNLTERARLTKEGYFAVGGSASHQLTVTGAGQAANALADGGAKGAVLYIRDTGGSPGSGGAIAFGANEDRPFAAIKGSLTNGTGNSLGDLMLSTRGSVGSTQLDPRWLWSFDGHYRPYLDNVSDIGAGSLRVRVVYAATGAINTSDARTKQQIDAVPDDWLDAWGDVRHVRFKFNAAVEEKGAAARWHVGYVAQEIRDAFAARALDATAIGLLCHDSWDARTEPEYVTETRIKRTPRATVSAGGLLDANGHPLVTWTYDEEPEEVQVATGEMIVTREAGDLWSIRPDECAAMEAAWQRREIARQDARIAALEAAA
tara:strand:- start:29458 stop:31119 length:1662 start_codon:yes stop_codon:yes gene_type:complete